MNFSQMTSRANAKVPLIVMTAFLVVIGAAIILIYTAPTDNTREKAPHEWDARTTARVDQALRDAEKAISDNQIDVALGIANQLHNEFPKDDRPLRLLMRIHLNLASIDKPTHMRKVIEYAEKGVALNPSDPEFHFGLGQMYSMNKDKNKALESFTRAHELAPREARFTFFIARLLYSMEKYDEAEIHYARTIELNDTYHQTYDGLAGIAASRERFIEAAGFLKKAMDRLPPEDTDDSDAYRERQKYLPTYGLARARYLVKAQKYMAALHALSALPQNLPPQPQAQRLLMTAEIYDATQQYEKAALLWTQLWLTESNNARAAAEAGHAYFKLKDYEKARQFLARGLAEKPYDQRVQELYELLSQHAEEADDS